MAAKKSSTKTKDTSAVTPAAASVPLLPTEADREAAVTQARDVAVARAKTVETEKSGTVYGYAVFDHDSQQITTLFVSGNDKQQREDALQHMGGLLGKTGDAPERNLSIVKITEA